MVTTPTSYMVIPMVQEQISEAGVPNERIEKNLTHIVKEVGWYADAIRNHKKICPPQHLPHPTDEMG